MIFDNFLRNRRGDQISAEDRAVLKAAVSEERVQPRRTTLIHRGEPIGVSTYLVSGFMCRYMDDYRGERQLVAVHIPGDFVDLHGYPLGRLDHDLATLTDCRIAFVPHRRLDAILAERPALAKLLWFSTLLDAAMHREWIFRLGRLPAVKRLGHFLCETEIRLRAVGLSDGHSFELPLTQSDLAEACGITAVHVNRMLRELRQTGLLLMKGTTVTITDPARLAKASEFDPDYLFFDPGWQGNP